MKGENIKKVILKLVARLPKQLLEDGGTHIDNICKVAFDELDQLIVENHELKQQLEEQKELVKIGKQIKEYGIDGWWCPNCKEMLDGSRVTYQERCDTCGHGVSWIEQKEYN